MPVIATDPVEVSEIEHLDFVNDRSSDHSVRMIGIGLKDDIYQKGHEGVRRRIGFGMLQQT